MSSFFIYIFSESKWFPTVCHPCKASPLLVWHNMVHLFFFFFFKLLMSCCCTGEREKLEIEDWTDCSLINLLFCLAALVGIYTILDLAIPIEHVRSDITVGGVKETLSLGTFSYCLNEPTKKCYHGFISQLVSNHDHPYFITSSYLLFGDFKDSDEILAQVKMGPNGFTKAPSISAFVAIGLTILVALRILTTPWYKQEDMIDDPYRRQMLFCVVWSVPLIFGVILDIIFLKNSSGGRAGVGFFLSIACIPILVLFGSMTAYRVWFCDPPTKGLVMESERGSS